MPDTAKKTPSLGGILIYPLVQQVIVLIMGALTLDDGTTFHVVCFAAIAYWIGAITILLRRRHHLTSGDTFFIHWGYPVLCILSVFIAVTVMNLKLHGLLKTPTW